MVFFVPLIYWWALRFLPTLGYCKLWEHCAKWNNLGSERQIPYDLTCKWNLINKTNKQAKYNQRHWNKEQTDSNQKGRRGITGKMRKGCQVTCIKDTWTKPKAGRIEGGRWGWLGWLRGKWRQLCLNNNK